MGRDKRNGKGRRVNDDRDAEIEGRLVAIEHDLKGLIELKSLLIKLAITLGILILSQGGAFVWGYAQLSRDVENIDVQRLEDNTATALGVLGQHGEEFRTVTSEQARLRFRIDQLQDKIEERTKDRFYRSDGDRLQSQLDQLRERVENHRHNHTGG